MRDVLQALRARVAGLLSGNLWFSVRFAMAVSIAAAFGCAAYTRWITGRSPRAIICAPLITLRSQIAGDVRLVNAADPGMEWHATTPLIEVSNGKLSREQIIANEFALATAGQDLQAAQSRLALASTVAAQAEAAVTQARNAVSEVDRRSSTPLNAEVAKLHEQKDALARKVERARELQRAGFYSEAGLDEIERDTAGAQSAINAREHQVRYEMMAADPARAPLPLDFDTGPRMGSLVQARLKAKLDLSAATIDLATRKLAVESLARKQVELVDENQRLEKASVEVPAHSRLLRRFVNGGDVVDPGQPVGEYLDCARTYVLAVVSGAVYEDLRVGKRMNVRVRNESYPGTVIAFAPNAEIGKGLYPTLPTNSVIAGKVDDAGYVLIDFSQVATARLGGQCLAGESVVVEAR